MQAIRTHVAGVDVHKEILAITVVRGSADEVPEVIQFECDTFTEDLMACGMKLLDFGVKEVAMESTGVYWKPVHNVWSPMGIEITVAQAAHVKNVPGRKTDMNDSHWLAELHRYGLIRSSFIPEEIFQRMRLVSRHRTNLVEDLSRIKNRVQRVLEDGNIKLATIASNVFGKSGLQVLNLLARGVTDASHLASAITTKIKRREEARKALTNCFTKQHTYVIKELMEQYHFLSQKILDAEKEIFELAKPYRHLMDRLKEIPGISDIIALGILSEATDQMDHFPDERKFAAWSGVAAGNNESAGKKKKSKCRKGNPHLRKLLIQAAHGAKQRRLTFYRNKYNRLKLKTGSANKAKVAIANRIARAVYKVLAGEKYRELGYKRAMDHEKKIQGLINQLKALGVEIKHSGHQKIVSVKKVMITESGVQLA